MAEVRVKREAAEAALQRIHDDLIRATTKVVEATEEANPNHNDVMSVAQSYSYDEGYEVGQLEAMAFLVEKIKERVTQ